MIELLYLFLPGYVANTVPPLLAKLPFLRRWGAPLDCGATWRGKRLLGDNKTWRGAFGGIVLGGLVFLLQQALVPTVPLGRDTLLALPWTWGLLFAFGAIVVGDAGKSVIKRRLGIKPGRPFVPWDQVDYTVGAFLVTFWIWWPGWFGFCFLLVVNALLTAVTHVIGHALRINKDRF